MQPISLDVRRKLKFLAEKMNSELYDTLTLKYTSDALDKKLLELTNIKPEPTDLATNEYLDQPPLKSKEAGIYYSTNKDCCDILIYPDPAGHKETIKIEMVCRHFFMVQLLTLESHTDTSIEKYAEFLTDIVILGKRSMVHEALSPFFNAGQERNIEDVIKALHDDYDIPMYVIFRYISRLFPKNATLIKNMTLVCHEDESEKLGVQAHYDRLTITGKNKVNRDEIKKFICKITSSPAFKKNQVAHCSMDSGMLVSKPMAHLIDPSIGKLEDCTLFVVSNTALIINF